MALKASNFFKLYFDQYKKSGWRFVAEKIDCSPFRSLNEMTEQELMDIQIDNRKETTWYMVSVNQDPVSMHFDHAFADDAETLETTANPAAIEKLNRFQLNLRPFAHNPRTWAVHYTGTAWRDALYKRLKTIMTSVIMPCRFFDDKEKKFH